MGASRKIESTRQGRRVYYDTRSRRCVATRPRDSGPFCHEGGLGWESLAGFWRIPWRNELRWRASMAHGRRRAENALR